MTLSLFPCGFNHPCILWRNGQSSPLRIFSLILGPSILHFTAHGRVHEQRVELYVISLYVLSCRPSAVHGCCTFHLSSLLRETAQPVTSAFAFLLMSTWAASASFLVILVVTESDHCCPFVLLHMCEQFSRLIPSSGTPGSWGVCTPLALPIHILCSCSIQIFVLFLLIPARSFYS